MKQNPYVLAIVKQAGALGMVKNLFSGALRTGATPIAGEVTAARAASTGFRPAGMAGGRFSPPPGVPRPARAGGPGTSLVPVTAKPNLPAANTPPKARPAQAAPPKAGPTQAAQASFGSEALNWARANPLKTAAGAYVAGRMTSGNDNSGGQNGQYQ